MKQIWILHHHIKNWTIVSKYKVNHLPFSKMVCAAWKGTEAKISDPGKDIQVFSAESWFPQVAHISLTSGFICAPSTSFITDSKGVGTLVLVVRAFLLKAVKASLFAFLNLSFSTSCQRNSPFHRYNKLSCSYVNENKQLLVQPR